MWIHNAKSFEKLWVDVREATNSKWRVQVDEKPPFIDNLINLDLRHLEFVILRE